jgi:hypothetical protein
MIAKAVACTTTAFSSSITETNNNMHANKTNNTAQKRDLQERAIQSSFTIVVRLNHSATAASLELLVTARTSDKIRIYKLQQLFADRPQSLARYRYINCVPTTISV